MVVVRWWWLRDAPRHGRGACGPAGRCGGPPTWAVVGAAGQPDAGGDVVVHQRLEGGRSAAGLVGGALPRGGHGLVVCGVGLVCVYLHIVQADGALQVGRRGRGRAAAEVCVEVGPGRKWPAAAARGNSPQPAARNPTRMQLPSPAWPQSMPGSPTPLTPLLRTARQQGCAAPRTHLLQHACVQDDVPPQHTPPRVCQLLPCRKVDAALRPGREARGAGRWERARQPRRAGEPCWGPASSSRQRASGAQRARRCLHARVATARGGLGAHRHPRVGQHRGAVVAHIDGHVGGDGARGDQHAGHLRSKRQQPRL